MTKAMENAIAMAVARLAMLKYFPTDQSTRALLMDEMASMCPTPESADWLGRRACAVFAEWPGIREIRALLCSRYRPVDGVNAYSEVYADGIPSEKPVAQIDDYARLRKIIGKDPWAMEAPQIAAPKDAPITVEAREWPKERVQ